MIRILSRFLFVRVLFLFCFCFCFCCFLCFLLFYKVVKIWLEKIALESTVLIIRIEAFKRYDIQFTDVYEGRFIFGAKMVWVLAGKHTVHLFYQT